MTRPTQVCLWCGYRLASRKYYFCTPSCNNSFAIEVARSGFRIADKQQVACSRCGCPLPLTSRFQKVSKAKLCNPCRYKLWRISHYELIRARNRAYKRDERARQSVKKNGTQEPPGKE